MIEINLLPDNLRINKQEAAGWDKIIQFCRVGIVVLAGINIVLFLACLFYGYRDSALVKVFAGISSNNSDIAAIKNDISAAEEKIKLVDKLTQSGYSQWAMRLNKLSSLLPRGVWFSRIRIAKDALEIQGSVVSLKGNEIEILNEYLKALRADALFYPGLKSIELGPIARSVIFGVEVTDFSLKGLLLE